MKNFVGATNFVKYRYFKWSKGMKGLTAAKTSNYFYTACGT